jgi:hypothetical protein
MKILQHWEEKDWRSIEPVGSAYLYGRYGRYATMFFAVCKPKAAVVKWMVTGSEYQQSLGREEGKQRTLQLFP